jgi:lycopene cyclase domain-containing protein
VVTDVQHLAYLGVLAFILIGAGWLEFVFRARVFSKPLRLVLALLPVIALLVVWDLYAISRHHWWFDPNRTTGIELPGHLPLEELLFFIVTPIAGVLTVEAVRSLKGWSLGDEPVAQAADKAQPDGPGDGS